MRRAFDFNRHCWRMFRRARTLCSIRLHSTLAEKLRAAVSEDLPRKRKSETSSQVAIEPQSTKFNEMFVMPKRKLRGQLMIEQATGRASLPVRSRPDIHDRLAVRRPRSEEMAVDQDWTAVWPAARSFASSVIPLPIRMGSRPDPEKRAPFKKQAKVKLSALQLSDFARDKLIRLASSRYDEKTDTLTVITDRCHTRKQNLDYAFYLLTAIYHEANKVEPWESLKQREDNLKVDFEGSETQTKLFSLLKQVASHNKFNSPVKKLGMSASHEQLSSDPNVKQFADMWNSYLNTEETPESTRKYAMGIKALLGLTSPPGSRV